jgi:hypothetical protein
MTECTAAMITKIPVYSNTLLLEPEGGLFSAVSVFASWIKWKTCVDFSPATLLASSKAYPFEDGSTLGVELLCSPKGGTDGLRAIYTHDDHKIVGRRWVTEVVLKTDFLDFEIDCTVNLHVEDVDVEAKPPIPSRPRLMVDLVESCRPSGRTPGLFIKPLTLGLAQKFLQEVNDIRRTVPIVLVNSNCTMDPPLNFERMREHLLGLAHIYQVTEDTDSWDLAQTLGREFSCYGDAIRVIWPASTWKTGHTSMMVLTKGKGGKPRTSHEMERMAVLGVFRKQSLD